jgi:succinate dehydrogenase / fumarate reductase cytochrome b subunit
MKEENRGGVLRWFDFRNYSLERFLYTIHRISGIGLVIWIVIHTIQNAFPRLFPFMYGWEYTVLLLILSFHAANGVRLLITELGFLLGKTYRPVYPYKMGVIYGTQRKFTVVILLVFFIIFLVMFYYLMLNMRVIT